MREHLKLDDSSPRSGRMANLPTFTTTFRRETYSDILPTNSELSAAGKIVVVTGAGGQIGKSICKAFVAAHAQYIAMLDIYGDSLRLAKTDAV